LAAFLLTLGLAPALWAAGETVSFITPPTSSYAVTYSTVSNNAVTFNIQAKNGGVNDNSFIDPVTVGFYDTATGLPAEPQAVWVRSDGSTVLGGVAPMTFVAGKLDFGVTLTAGSDSMQVSITDGNITSGNTYPGTIGNTSGPGYICRGYFTSYYAETSSGTTVAAVYSPSPTPGPTDLLLTVPSAAATAAYNPIYAIVPISSSVTNSLSFAVTGVNAGYAAGGAGVSINLAFERQSSLAQAVTVYYEVILDYNTAANGLLTDYNNPRLGIDSVYAGIGNVTKNITGDNGANPSIVSGAATFVTGYASPQPFMTNGQIILRVWTGATAPQTVYFWWTQGSGVDNSYITVPYASKNTAPVRSTITLPGSATVPATVLGNSPVTLLDSFFNQYSSSITQLMFQVPPNSPASGVSWNFSSVGVPGAGNSGSAVNPTASNPGTITVNCQNSPFLTNNTYAVTLIGTSSSQDGSWPMSVISAISSFGTSAPTDSNLALIDTLGAPDTPGSFTAAPANYAGAGNQISLSWSASVSENPAGYVITRSPGGGSFGTVTLPTTVISNAVSVMPAGNTSYLDTSATNLTGYTYTIQSFNNVSLSGTATAAPNPVTAFANPATPGPVTALTGGTAVQLNWAAPSSVLGSYAVTGYQIWRDTQASMATAVTIASLAGLTYNDTAVTAGTAYYYGIASLDSQYSSGAPGAPHIGPLSGPVSGYPPGNPPTGLAANMISSSPATIQATWSAPNPVNMLNGPATGYQVEISPDGAGASFVTVGSTSLSDNSVTISHFYVFQVWAFDNKGVLSNPAGPVTGWVGPPAPASLAANPSTSAVTLLWPAVTPVGAETVANYVIYRNGTPIVTPVPTASPTVSAYDATAVVGTDYFYQVASVDQGGVTGGPSNGVSSALLLPAPTGLALSLNLTNDNVTVSWATPSPAEPNLKQYSLTQAIGTATPTVIATPTPAVVSYLDTSITSANAGQTITYNLSAQNDLGGVGPPAIATVIVPPNPPGTPTAVSSSSAITLTWPAVSNQGVTGYTVYRYALPSGTPTPIATPAAATYIDNSASLVEGTNYVYYVTASNAGGAGLISTPVTTALQLPAPASLTASVSATGTQFNVGVTWTAPPSSGNMTGYNLLRNTTASLTGDTTLLSAAATTTTNYQDVLATNTAGTTYFYMVQALDVSGAGVTAMAGFQVPPNPPGIPTPTSAFNAITLVWQGRPGAENVSNYTLFRVNPGPVTVTIGSTGSGSVTTLVDTGTVSPLSQGVTYQYYVTATNPGGGTGVPGGTSLPSATVNTGLAPPAPTGLAIASIDASNDIGVTWNNVTVAAPNAIAVSLLVNANSAVTTGAAVTNITPISAVTFFDNGVFTASVTGESPDTTYSYWLETVDPFGTSAPAGPFSQLTYPAPVTLQSVSPLPDGISRAVNWTTVGTGDVNTYNVYRQLIGASSFVSITSYPANVTQPVTLVASVLPGKTYIFKVTAVNATGEGPNANFVTVGVPPSVPAPVTAVSGVNTSVQVNLSWPANAPSESVTGYAIYRGTSASWASAVSLNSVPVTNYSDTTGLSGPATFYYWVEAYGSDGTSSVATTATSSVTVTAFALANAPTGLAETDLNGSAGLTWTAATATTYPIAGYNLYYSASGGATVKANATPVPASPFTVQGLTNGVTTTLWAQAVDSQGNLSALSADVTAIPAAPPGVPGSVGASPGNNQDQVSWVPSIAGSLPVSYYLVQRVAGAVTTTFQVPATLTGYVDTTATNPNVYTYSVEAVDTSVVATGVHVSGFSAGAAVTTGQITINPPSQLSAVGGNALVTLKWTDSTGSSSPVTGYQIYRAPASGGPYSVLNTAPTTVTQPNAYTDSASVTNGNTYYYYLVSNANGVTSVSANSATIFATAASPPAAPTPVLKFDGSNSVTLSWTASPNEGPVTILDYVLTQAILPAAATTLGATSGPVTTYTDSSVNNSGETVVYQVEAVNSNGTTGALSAPVTGYPYAPFPPTGFFTSASSTAVTANWTAPGSTTWPLAGYDLIRTPLSGGIPVTISTAGSPLADSGVTLGQLYVYTLASIDNKGNMSTAASPVTDGPCNQIAAPATVIATAGSGQVLLDWPTSAPVSGSFPVSEYQVTLSDNSGTTVFLTTQTWYLVQGLTDPAGVTAVVQAVDETGNLVGNDISVSITGGPVTSSTSDLNPPTSLAATALGPSSVRLTWTRPNDMGYNVTSYNIYRASNFTTALGSPITTLANPALSPVTIYNDSNVSPNTTYYYVLTAVYSSGPSGSGPVTSPASNHASITTPAPAAGIPPVTVGQMAFDANLLKPLTGQVLGIYFVAPDSGPVVINVYDISGRPIRVLNASAVADAQVHLTWDGKDRNGYTVASGLYFVEIKAPGLHQIKKVLVVK
jgi:fibronectin type 3 domain-containing protein